ncbi:MAG: DUF2806 domain-containing protein [Brucellaceae bacterium]|jgi:hypothetical protein|nr:DUF2806 domain-containing protein [Brucellaceae bacterium]
MVNDIEPNNGGWLSAIANYDWLKIPGAVRAVSQLVTGTADVGLAFLDAAKAKGEQLSQGIRDTTSARTKTLEAYTDAAIKAGINDPRLIERTLDYTAIKGIREQSNREKIAQETVLLLEGQAIPEETPAPEDDWMNVFVDYAGKASSERMQKHWANLLAGQIKKPGSYSLSTLQVMSVMDSNLANIIEKFSGSVLDNMFIAQTPKNSTGYEFFELENLVSLGLVTGNNKKNIAQNPNTLIYEELFNYYDQRIVLRSKTPFSFQCRILTFTGREIFSLAGHKPDPDFVPLFIEVIKSNFDHIEVLFL